jgi:hypothetical protein
MATSVYLLQTENRMSNFRLFAANGNGKRKFVFLGRQTINGIGWLLCERKCPSMFRWYQNLYMVFKNFDAAPFEVNIRGSVVFDIGFLEVQSFKLQSFEVGSYSKLSLVRGLVFWSWVFWGSVFRGSVFRSSVVWSRVLRDSVIRG